MLHLELHILLRTTFNNLRWDTRLLLQLLHHTHIRHHSPKGSALHTTRAHRLADDKFQVSTEVIASKGSPVKPRCFAFLAIFNFRKATLCEVTKDEPQREKVHDVSEQNFEETTRQLTRCVWRVVDGLLRSDVQPLK